MHNFRSYRELDVSLKPGVSVLTGLNGAGKTNFLEALSLFSPGRGLRKAASGDFARIPPRTPQAGDGPYAYGGRDQSDQDQNNRDQNNRAGEYQGPVLVGTPGPNKPPASKAWAVSARLNTPNGAHQIGTGLEPAKGERRIIRVDGTNLKGQARLPSYVSVLWLTPRMDGLFVDTAPDRRGFLDQLVMAFDPGHAGELAAYLHSMRERGRLLRQSRLSGRAADPAWLASLEDSMSRHGIAIAAARRAYCRQIAPVFAAGHAPFPGGSLALKGYLERELDRQKALELEDRYRQDLAAARGTDRDAGRATLGPHTSDLIVWNSAHGRLAADCSTGEQKALLVALILAHGRLLADDQRRLPVYLLDEVAAHFDETRRCALFTALVTGGAQVFLTGTDRVVFAALEGRATFLRVRADSLQEG